MFHAEFTANNNILGLFTDIFPELSTKGKVFSSSAVQGYNMWDSSLK
jgi:hypothetical protein